VVGPLTGPQYLSLRGFFKADQQPQKAGFPCAVVPYESDAWLVQLQVQPAEDVARAAAQVDVLQLPA